MKQLEDEVGSMLQKEEAAMSLLLQQITSNGSNGSNLGVAGVGGDRGRNSLSSGTDDSSSLGE